MITGFDKALAAVVVPLVVQLLGRVGFNLDAAFVDALTVLLTGIVVYLIPNKPTAAAD